MPIGVVADGLTIEKIIADFPELEPEDIRAALHFAAEAVREQTIPRTPTS